MNLLEHLRRRLRHFWIPTLLIAVVGYFAYHAVQGKHGILAWQRIQQDLVTAEARRDRLAEERQQLAHRVLLLRPDSLDPDLLDEQARRLLSFGQPDERIILLDSENARSEAIN